MYRWVLLKLDFWEYESLSDLWVIQLISTIKYTNYTKIFWKKIQVKWESGLTTVWLNWDPLYLALQTVQGLPGSQVPAFPCWCQWTLRLRLDHMLCNPWEGPAYRTGNYFPKGSTLRHAVHLPVFLKLILLAINLATFSDMTMKYIYVYNIAV